MISPSLCNTCTACTSSGLSDETTPLLERVDQVVEDTETSTVNCNGSHASSNSSDFIVNDEKYILVGLPFLRRLSNRLYHHRKCLIWWISSGWIVKMVLTASFFLGLYVFHHKKRGDYFAVINFENAGSSVGNSTLQSHGGNGAGSTSLAQLEEIGLALPQRHRIRHVTRPATTTTTNDGDGHQLDMSWSQTNTAEDNHNNIKLDKTIPLVQSREGFPSFLDYQGQSSIHVSYDDKAILLNGQRVLLLGGSIHPYRTTPQTWEYALREAVDHGLNLITFYVIWSVHQPRRDSPFRWSLLPEQSTGGSRATGASSTISVSAWDLASAVRTAAAHGLFVHIRLGPYVCAEYSYGGIPAWLPLQDSSMSMRRPEPLWIDAMRGYLAAVVDYLTNNQLFAFQGGPIIMAQVENELGNETSIDDDTSEWYHVDKDGNFVQERGQESDTAGLRKATIQDYANWCGRIAQDLAPKVLWTMCNGLSAPNTVLTYNGDFFDNSWIKAGKPSHQPALWTEDEGGFQIWGDSPTHPSDYFWGITASAQSFHVLQWLARGGRHVNYYMWWGSYNRYRQAAAGILNAYAADTFLCPSGERHEPKFSHFQSLHGTVASIAHMLLERTAKVIEVEVFNGGEWSATGFQHSFVYEAENGDGSPGAGKFAQSVAIVLNDANTAVTVRLNPSRKPTTLSGDYTDPIRRDNIGDKTGSVLSFTMAPYSARVIVDGSTIFDSATIGRGSISYRRQVKQLAPPHDWHTWNEPMPTLSLTISQAVVWPEPIEQTELLNLHTNISSDYVWYATELTLPSTTIDLVLHIDTELSNAFVIFVDGVYRGAAETHPHAEGNVTLSIPIGSLEAGKHELLMLSESFGYQNLIGRWGAKVKAKRKGITGRVYYDGIVSGKNLGPIDLVDGRNWRSVAGLYSERNASHGDKQRYVTNDWNGESLPAWTKATFITPRYEPERQYLYLDLTVGRGHVYLNGNDLGRYWNITRTEDDYEQSSPQATYSQRYYFLPPDYLAYHGQKNELLIFDVFGGGATHSNTTSLILSWIEPDTDGKSAFLDQVGYPGSCLL